jgi:hypothetical protein
MPVISLQNLYDKVAAQTSHQIDEEKYIRMKLTIEDATLIEATHVSATAAADAATHPTPNPW